MINIKIHRYHRFVNMQPTCQPKDRSLLCAILNLNIIQITLFLLGDSQGTRDTIFIMQQYLLNVKGKSLQFCYVLFCFVLFCFRELPHHLILKCDVSNKIRRKTKIFIFKIEQINGGKIYLYCSYKPSPACITGTNFMRFRAKKGIVNIMIAKL